MTKQRQPRIWIAVLSTLVAVKLCSFSAFVSALVTANQHRNVVRRPLVGLHQADSSESAMVDTIWSKTDQSASVPGREANQTRQRKWREKQDQNGHIFVSNDFRAKRIATRIKKRMQLTGRVVLRTIGARPTNEVLKAISRANEMLQGSDLKGEQVLGAVPYFKEIRSVGSDGEDEVSNVLFFECMLLPRPRLEDVTVDEKQVLATGVKEKISKMAAAVKSRLRENAVAVVLGRGAGQLHLAVKAILLAGRFLREDEGESGEKLKVPAIALMPAMQEFAPRHVKSSKHKKRGEDDEVSIGMRLECVDVRDRWDPSASEGVEDSGTEPNKVTAPWEEA
ncbi:unnamed protein product [Symbiodinium natans]|uniref:Uncharacterized protein n=1 Tax=Symbiodinium natans TaxID=878477 RepID=A0A812SYZ6_9DINO|nr:unnamed protein product [Symbiodinium natans]